LEGGEFLEDSELRSSGHSKKRRKEEPPGWEI